MPASLIPTQPRRSCFGRWALVAGLLLSAAPATARGQQVGGAIGVSLTVLQPVSTQPVRVTEFHVDRDGVAHLETTAPTSAHASQLVMATVASSASGFSPVPQSPALLAADAADARLSYRLQVGRATGGTQRPVELRVQYLTVAGT
jgi:hypothetical protein